MVGPPCPSISKTGHPVVFRPEGSPDPLNDRQTLRTQRFEPSGVRRGRWASGDRPLRDGDLGQARRRSQGLLDTASGADTSLVIGTGGRCPCSHVRSPQRGQGQGSTPGEGSCTCRVLALRGEELHRRSGWPRRVPSCGPDGPRWAVCRIPASPRRHNPTRAATGATLELAANVVRLRRTVAEMAQGCWREPPVGNTLRARSLARRELGIESARWAAYFYATATASSRCARNPMRLRCFSRR
jgi:hypothetical protein